VADILEEIEREQSKRIPVLRLAVWAVSKMASRLRNKKNTTTSRDVRRFWRCPHCTHLNPPDLGKRCMKCNKEPSDEETSAG